MRGEQLRFRPRHSTSLQLACLVERITRNFGEKRLTGAVFLDVANAFDTVWIDGLLYKLTLLNFPSYIVHTISSYLRGRTSKRPSRRPRHLVEVCGLGWLRGISPVLFSLYVNDMTPTLVPRLVGPLRGRHGHHSHVPPVDDACQLPGVMPQRPSTVVE